jgi:hypothetical protein
LHRKDWNSESCGLAKEDSAGKVVFFFSVFGMAFILTQEILSMFPQCILAQLARQGKNHIIHEYMKE